MNEPMPRLLDEEERILRVWTPVLLRTILVIAVALLLTGLTETLWQSSNDYADSLRQVQRAAPEAHEPIRYIVAAAADGSATAFAMLGLMVLTLVPLMRVGFCLLLFLKQRNRRFAFFTSYVLAGLAIGVMLGKIG